MRYFTVEEANETLQDVEPLMARLIETRAKVAAERHTLGDAVHDLYSDIGGATASAMTLDFMTIERLAAEIQSHGCLIKDINAGLIDFPAKKDGRDILLCWRYGESAVAFFHSLDDGFNGRHPL